MASPRAFLLVVLCAIQAVADESVSRALQLEMQGDALGARAALEKAARASDGDREALEAYANFLDRRSDPGARAAYEKLLAVQERSSDKTAATATARRLVVLSLLAEDRTGAIRHLETYRRLGGNQLTAPQQAMRSSAEVETRSKVEIPGPLRSFARMAALSPDLSPEDSLPALARNIVTNGYQAASSNEGLEQTEYLKLVFRYLTQARELDKLAGQGKIIKIETCESALTGDLLRVLGYRMRGGCGAEVVLETVNASRAFLTIDSGFPLAELEQKLRTNQPFTYDYHPTQVPILYGPEYWLGGVNKEKPVEFIDAFMSDPTLCRLYLGMAKLDRDTAEAMRKALPVTRIKAFAHVLDFFGGMFVLDNGKVNAPGGPKANAAWADLTGVSPDQGVQFLEKLLTKDDGWIASYFDSLGRIHGPVLTYLTSGDHLKRFYTALRGRITSPGPARPVFRSNTDLMLLTTRLRIEPDGKVHIPGGLDVWRNLFVNHPQGKYDGKLTKAASGWKEPEEVIEALFGLSRKAVENEPLKIFMALSDINRRRATPLAPATVDRLARDYRRFGSQYSLLTEAPTLSDAAIIAWMDTIGAISNIKEQGFRADSAGMMQSLVGLWQIFCRNEAIPVAKADATFSAIIAPFSKLKGNRDLFEAGYTGVKLLLAETNTPANITAQDRFIDLLAGAATPDDAETHTQLVQDMIRIFEAQRLVSLSTIMELADHVEALQKGEKLNTQLIARLTARISEIQLPRAALSGVEKNAFAFGYWTERHIEAQRKFNFRAAVEKAANDSEKLKEIRASLAMFLRDTLVGFNYIHYAPPGAQVLITNPLFVRSHDFLGVQGAIQTWRATEVLGTGWPSSGGGRLVGSLSGLPYALAEAEQNFLIPSREQALIWGDLVPQMILTAKVARFWKVTPAQMHWVALHVHQGESLIAESVLDPTLRQKVISILDRQAPPARVRRMSQLVEQGNVRAALEQVTPSELFVLASDYLAEDKNAPGVLASSIRRLSADPSAACNFRAVSRLFGTPKPTLANSYQPELLNLRTFPTLMGYSSRIMAESWESNLIYFATLADELYLRPSSLNVYVPEWTQKTVEGIFATHLEDWPALLRSMRSLGDDLRSKSKKQQAASVGQ